MTSHHAYSELLTAFERFPEICQQMNVARAYCTCQRGKRYPCLMAKEVEQLLHRFLGEFEVAPREGISCIQDFAVNCAAKLFWEGIRSETSQVRFLCLEFSRQAELSSIAQDLSYLLLEVDEARFPPKEPSCFKTWKCFVDTQKQHRQICLVAAYAGVYQSSSIAKDVKKKMTDSLNSFKDAHLELERRQHLNSNLQRVLNRFAFETAQWCQLIVQQLHWTYKGYKSNWKISSPSWYRHEITASRADSPLTFVRKRRDFALESLSKVSDLASQVAKHCSSFDSPEMTSQPSCQPSWSVFSRSARDEGMPPTDLQKEVGSVTSGYSADSQASCLSGHGGSHCFLPSHRFKVLQSEAPAVSLVLAQDLQKGAKIFSADGTTIQVAKVEKKKANKSLELEIDDAVPLIITASHRIVVTSDSEDATLLAVDVKLGSWVMCSDQVAKKVIGKREYVVEEQEVLSITFHPDKAVECYLPPEQPVVLTKGKTPRPTRRGGMGGRGLDLMSMPDTAAGEYDD